ncbi:hypothetical protein EW026_g1463 [Hermanssonia centrifuga]|uniref:CRAL/TRIO N-terminal domain-containing protein n=1 Tax=Hermanssonia centrifuga TaxID=98765 RepID=A0A4S4KT86_9APHY|nr:hypothetical protein EW026_g1463 [Hermanssonia centrifuga]
MAKTHEVLVLPASGTEIAPVHQYNEDQKAKMKALLEHAHTLVLPESDSYREWELRWLNKSDTIPRYMRAAKWDLEDAKKRIRGTLQWRREFKPDLIPPEEVLSYFQYVLELIPKEQLDAAFGGDFEYEFEPVSYWEQIVSACGIAPDGTRLNAKDALPEKAEEADEKANGRPSHAPSVIDHSKTDEIMARNPHEFDILPEATSISVAA